MDGSSLGKPEQRRIEQEGSKPQRSRSKYRDTSRGRETSPRTSTRGEAASTRESKPGAAVAAAAHPADSTLHPTHPSPSAHRHRHHYQDRARSRHRRRSRSRTSARNFDAEAIRASSRHLSPRRYPESLTLHKRRNSRSPSTPRSQHQHNNRRRSLSAHDSPSRAHRYISSAGGASGARSPRPAQKEGAVADKSQVQARDNTPPRHWRSPSADSRQRTGSTRDRRPDSSNRHRWRDEERSYYHERHSYGRRHSRSPPAKSERGVDRAYLDTRRNRDEAYPRRQRVGRSPARVDERGSRRPSRSPPHPPSRANSRDGKRAERPGLEPGRIDRPGKRSLSRESRLLHKDEENDTDMYGRGGYGGWHRNSYQQSGHHSHSQSPYQHNNHGYQQGGAQPGVPYYQPRPGNQYGASPNYPAPDSFRGAAQRGGLSVRGTAGRAHFANLSWTPGDGVKGGNLVTTDKTKDSATSKPASQPKSVVALPEPDDDDNPFRPPADLRAEDESASKRRRLEPTTGVAGEAKTTEEQAAQAEREKSKISFSIKGRASIATAEKTPVVTKSTKSETSPLQSKRIPSVISPLVQSTVSSNMPKSSNYVGNTRVGPPRGPSPPRTRKEMVRKKRIKARPQLPEEHAQSDSVYYRKTGNDSVVGSGTYGKVYKAVHVYTGGQVALKKIRMEGERDGFPVTAIREIKLLQSLNHTNVVPLLEVMVERNDCFMVFEYLSHDLTGLLNHPTFALTSAHKKHLAKQMFEGLDYLHKRGVLHRDIKAANILISKSGVLKFADFGLARFYQKRQKQDYTNRVITIWYRSPELLLGETQYGPAVDIWSAACVLVEIFTRHAIFPGDGGEINQLDKIYNILGTPSRSEWPNIAELQWFELLRPPHRLPSTFKEKYQDKVSPEAFELLQAMFLYDPANRPTAADVLEHPYFTAEEPGPAQVVELADLEGDWHEFESKALRKEKERQEREARREKRKADEAAAGSDPKKVKMSDAPQQAA